MGCVIATLYSRHGYDVVVNDVQTEMLQQFGTRAMPIASAITGDEAHAKNVVDRIRFEGDLERAVEGAILVHEVVQEVLSVKQALFHRLDRLCRENVVIATNTSSFLLSQIATDVTHKRRVLGIHYVTPAHIVRVVELIHAEFTPPEVVEWGGTFVSSLDHVDVAIAERPGFLVNRIQFAMLSEIYRLMDEGLASREGIDAAVRLSLGPRLALWGPLLTEDLVVSKRTALAVTDSLYDQTGDENFKARKALRQLVDQGHLGALTGKGWYEFGRGHEEVVTERDRQLAELLTWLRDYDAVGRIGVRSPAPSSPNRACDQVEGYLGPRSEFRRGIAIKRCRRR